MTRWRAILQRRRPRGLMPLDDALEALGRDGDTGWRVDDVPLATIVGSATRAIDFDEEFRLVNKAMQHRWDGLARAVESGIEPPAVELVQLGELYFVSDGHHRVSVARARGQRWITARVQRICTVAYARSCLRLAHLPTKAAERRFLERVPLPDVLRAQLWLDDPAQWTRLTDAVEAWGLRHARAHGELMSREELAASWWTEEVEPLVTRLRDAGVGTDLRDVQLYVTALAVRDRLGGTSWPADLLEHMPSGLRRGTRTG